MNQIYRVIWSRIKCCYIVVSELTKSVGRENFSIVSRHSLYALVCVITIIGGLMTSVAEASFNGGIGSSTVTANSILSEMMPKQQRNILLLLAADLRRKIFMP